MPTRERILLGLAVVGFVVPNAMVFAFLVRHGLDLDQYFSAWVNLLPAAQLLADLAIVSVSVIAWASWDGPRSGVKLWWVTIPATALAGICFAVPLYLLLRERALRIGEAA